MQIMFEGVEFTWDDSTQDEIAHDIETDDDWEGWLSPLNTLFGVQVDDQWVWGESETERQAWNAEEYKRISSYGNRAFIDHWREKMERQRDGIA